MLPFMFVAYGLQLKSIIYSETQDGKGTVDSHFAAVIRHEDAFIEKDNLLLFRRLNFDTPSTMDR